MVRGIGDTTDHIKIRTEKESMGAEVDYESGDEGTIMKAEIFAAIGRSVVRGLKPEIGRLLRECTSERPARISTVKFEARCVRFTIRWPFRAPMPTGTADDWLGSSASVKDFLRRFRSYLMEQRAGRRLANMFFDEFGRFLVRYFRIHRFADYQYDDPDDLQRRPRTVKEILQSVTRERASRRLAGAPRLRLPKRLAAQAERQGRIILKTILRIQDDLKAWVKQAKEEKRSLTETELMNRVVEKYHTDRTDWMSSFPLCFRKLKLKSDYRGAESKPLLSRPRSFSPVQLARLIIRRRFYREHGFEIPQEELGRLITSRPQNPSNVKPT